MNVTFLVLQKIIVVVVALNISSEKNKYFLDSYAGLPVLCTEERRWYLWDWFDKVETLEHARKQLLKSDSLITDEGNPNMEGIKK